MRVYWKDVRRGQSLILSEQEGHEEVIGGFRETGRGIDAQAQTFGYDPGRSQKGFATIEDAKAFVESFKPWELHGAHDVTVESEAGPDSNPGSIAEPDPPVTIAEPDPPVTNAEPNPPVTSAEPDPPVTNAEPAVLDRQSAKHWWEFWRNG